MQETDAMVKAVAVLEPLEPAQRSRIANYLFERYKLSPAERLLDMIGSSPLMGSTDVVDVDQQAPRLKVVSQRDSR